MKSEDKKEKFKKEKEFSVKRFIRSVKNSIAGLVQAYQYEQSLSIHTVITILVVALGFILRIDGTEWLFSLAMIGLVVTAELLNTAIEAAVDLTTLEIHPLAKRAKDTASSAVFVISCVAFVMGLIVFLPKIIDLTEKIWKM